jgi:lipid II:glycine glycyltransferase (peptidoglycan interpeptide bridge formation enzyme)
VAKAKSMGAEIVYDFELEFMDKFIELYRMTVERIKMDQYYNFGNDYFRRVVKELKEFSTLIHISVDNNKIIGSGLYLHYGSKATLHLVGSNSNYQHVRINDLLYNGAIQLSIKNNISTLNVGGGTSLNPEDTLFKFKSKFSKNFKDVLIGKNVINQDVYNNLTKQWTSMHPELSEKNANYFLKYRIKGNLQLARK